MLKTDKLSKKQELIIALLLLTFGFFIRTVMLGRMPLGLNQDEASAGYEAWALLNYGIDRNGYSLPVLFVSWGSGQNVLYSYLAMPFIALFGLSEFSLRLPMAISGLAALLFFWLSAKKIRGQKFGLFALAFLALCPWHIMASRWALESNLLPTFLLGGIYFCISAEDNPKYLIPASLFFGLSLYAYGTAFFFLPPFLLFAIYTLRHKLTVKALILPAFLFFVLAMPITICQIQNVLALPAGEFLGLSIPKLTATRQGSTTILNGGSLFSNLKNLLRILIFQRDGLPFNYSRVGGLFYFFSLPFAVLGIILSVKQKVKSERYLFAALIISLVSSLFIISNINRINMLWLPLCYFIALGLFELSVSMRMLYFIPALCVVVSFMIFAYSYVNDFGTGKMGAYFPGLGEAISYTEKQNPKSVYVSGKVNSPYIFVLFYGQIPPHEFIDDVRYVNPNDEFRWVRSFGKYSFGNAYYVNTDADFLILHRSEIGERKVLEYFGQFAVCRQE